MQQQQQQPPPQPAAAAAGHPDPATARALESLETMTLGVLDSLQKVRRPPPPPFCAPSRHGFPCKRNRSLRVAISNPDCRRAQTAKPWGCADPRGHHGVQRERAAADLRRATELYPAGAPRPATLGPPGSPARAVRDGPSWAAQSCSERFWVGRSSRKCRTTSCRTALACRSARWTTWTRCVTRPPTGTAAAAGATRNGCRLTPLLPPLCAGGQPGPVLAGHSAGDHRRC